MLLDETVDEFVVMPSDDLCSKVIYDVYGSITPFHPYPSTIVLYSVLGRMTTCRNLFDGGDHIFMTVSGGC
jgi:hypothetical protein